VTAYDNTPNSKVQMLISGSPAYAFGSQLPGPTCRMLITNDSCTSNVVTLSVTIVEGNIPLVGDLIYTYATVNSAGGINQTTGIAIASVAITAATGKGTITFPLTLANQGATADVGYALSTPGQTTEVCAVGKSRAFAIQNTIGRGYGISWAYTCPSAPSTIAIQLEGAINDNDSEYTIIGASQTTAAGAEVFASVPELVNFVRLHVTATTGGTSPTISAKILLS
jgi:hypothetical protein